MIGKWGRKGPGPQEFLMPYFSHYQDNRLAVMDFGKRKIFLFDRIGKTGLKEKKFFQCIGLGDDIRLNGNQLLISGYKVDDDGRRYDLYLINTDTGKPTYLLPVETKYGFNSYKAYKTNDRNTKKFRTISRVSYCTMVKDIVYYVWQGHLKIFKINAKSKNISHFGTASTHYIKPYASKKLIESRLKKDTKTTGSERRKMSFVMGLFAADHYVAVLYTKAPHTKTTPPHMMIQFYSPSGKLLKEKQMENKPTNGLFFRKSDQTLFSLRAEVDDQPGDDGENIYILEYKIQN